MTRKKVPKHLRKKGWKGPPGSRHINPFDPTRAPKIIENAMQGKTMAETAREWGISRERVRQLLVLAGLSDVYAYVIGEIMAKKYVTKRRPVKTCAKDGCNRPVVPLSHHIYCSQKCRRKARKIKQKKVIEWHSKNNPIYIARKKAYNRIQSMINKGLLDIQE